MIEVVGLVLGEIDQVGLGVISEHEPDPFVVPAVEVSGQGEVGVASQQNVGEPAGPAQVDGLVVERDDALMGGAVGAMKVDEQRLFGVGQADYQRRVPPDAVVGDVHPGLGLAGGGHDRRVGVDAGGLAQQ